MLVTITSKRQVTFPAHVLTSLGAKAGDQLELLPSPDGFLLKPRRVDASRLAPLRGKLAGLAAFDIQTFRDQPHDPALRD
jgi:AbrB family looped-hinge helix DNA binding protein